MRSSSQPDDLIMVAKDYWMKLILIKILNKNHNDQIFFISLFFCNIFHYNHREINFLWIYKSCF
jgi:hypothetical protein